MYDSRDETIQKFSEFQNSLIQDINGKQDSVKEVRFMTTQD